MTHLPLRAVLALALPALALTACDSTDDGPDGGTDASLGLYVTSNPDGVNQDKVVRLSDDLVATQAEFTALTGATSIQSIAFDDGDAFLTVDLAGSTGGLVYLSGLCAGDEGECSNTGATLGAGTRVVAGLSTGLVAPKGLVVADDRVFVADNGSNSVRVFSASATGNVSPEFVITDLGEGTNVWDVAYDGDDDRLYVASTNGFVLVYDDVLERRGTDGPDRTITPADGSEPISVNLHGIAYDDDRDILVLSDVGSATDAADGQLFTVASASTASGVTAVRYRVSGNATRLGNPVDLVLASNGTVYVAEKSNDRVLRFNGVLSATGTSTAAANAQIAVTKPESVSLGSDD